MPDAHSLAFERGFPTESGAQSGHDDADFQAAVKAYRFWYPTVSVEGIFNGNREVGIADNESIGIAATGPRQVGFTLNSDTPYGAGALDLSDGPMVIELPRPYIGLVDDHRQRWVMDMGIPGPDGGNGGKHVVLPPGYDGPVPADHLIGHCASMNPLLALRALPVRRHSADDRRVRATEIYPLDLVRSADAGVHRRDRAEA